MPRLAPVMINAPWVGRLSSAGSLSRRAHRSQTPNRHWTYSALRSATMSLRRCAVALGVAVVAALGIGTVRPLAQTGPRIEVTIASAARGEPTTGMVYVAIGRDNQRTPIDQASPTGAPLFSKYIDAVRPGTVVALTSADRGHPLASLADLPAGDYWMQPFVNVYTQFPRADGKIVWLHMDQWEGQNWK